MSYRRSFGGGAGCSVLKHGESAWRSAHNTKTWFIFLFTTASSRVVCFDSTTAMVSLRACLFCLKHAVGC